MADALQKLYYLVIISSAIAIPASWFVMNIWHQKYAYRSPSVARGSLLFLSVLVVFRVAPVITVGWHAVRSSRRRI